LNLLATGFHRIIQPFSSTTRATGFLLSKKEHCIFSPGYFIAPTRRRHSPADAKRGFKDGIMRDELHGIFLIKKQSIMILANIVLFAI
jgi:hypothetical protein